MKNGLKRYNIKIPKLLNVYLCKNNKFLLIGGTFGFKILKLKTILFLLFKDDLIFVTRDPLDVKFKFNKKQLKTLQGLTVALIKKSFFDVSRKYYKKLKLCGVGFKIMSITFGNINLLHFNLGFSHSIYFKVPKDIQIKDYTPTKFIIFGNSNEKVTSVAAYIRGYKLPEPYKGKGILDENETIILKEGKKT